jgi:hypothetical protein
MGMSFENNNLTPAEQKEMERLEAERKKALENEPTFTAIGAVTFFDEPYLLLVGEDKKWYKAPYVKETQLCPQRNSPKISTFDMENITLVTENEFYSYFQRK